MHHIDGLMQKSRNSIANALDLRLACPNLSIFFHDFINGFPHIEWPKLIEI